MNLEATYEPLRILLQDLDPSVRRYPDAVLGSAVRTALTLQRVPGLGVTPDKLAFAPEPSPNEFARVLLYTALLFVSPLSDSYKYQTRALSESWSGRSRDWLMELYGQLSALENAGLFLGWQDLYSWFKGNEGLPLGFTLTHITVDAPLREVSLGSAGIMPAVPVVPTPL